MTKNYRAYLAATALSFVSVLCYGEPPVLDLVWPPEGHHYWVLHSSFIFGSVRPATARVTVNGRPLSIYRTGAFLAMVPLSIGKFPLVLKASSGQEETEFIRTVVVDPAPETLPRNADHLDPDYFVPKDDMTLSPGDWLRLGCKGPPGARASFKIGEGDYQPMAEVEPQEPFVSAGVYKADFFIPSRLRCWDARIRFRLIRKDGQMVFGRAPGRLSVSDGGVLRVCEMKNDLVTVTTGPDKNLGYDAFLPKGVRAGITGSWGTHLRIGFGHRQLGWVARDAVTMLPEGTPAPHSILGSLVVDTLLDPVGKSPVSTIITVPLEAKHPFKVEQMTEPQRLKVLLYGVTADMDKVHYKSGASCVKSVRWRQLENGLCELDVLTNQTYGWGYDIRYERSGMIIEIRHAPPLRPGLSRPLAGLVVALDAGHSPGDPGATGPLRTGEDAVNLWVARQLEASLKSLGAHVVMIRKNNETIDLLQRTRLAWEARAHLFISLHNNSIADSGNPLEDNGFSIHFWAPHSHLLAEAVHAAYQANIPLKDRGILYDNLAVCRMTQMPSILTESAFIILPEQEAMLLDPAFRDKLAKTIAQGIQQFLKKAIQ